MGKLTTPDWVLEGYKSKEEYERKKGIKSTKSKGAGKTYKVRKCPECASKNVAVVLTGEEGKNPDWECKKCKWQGKNADFEEVSEEEFLELEETRPSDAELEEEK